MTPRWGLELQVVDSFYKDAASTRLHQRPRACSPGNNQQICRTTKLRRLVAYPDSAPQCLDIAF